MNKERQILLRWFNPAKGGRTTLPTGSSYSTVARFEVLASRWPQEAWSLVIEFEEPPCYDVEQRARARFLLPDAPPDLLQPGSRFELFEGDRIVAMGRVLDEPSE